MEHPYYLAIDIGASSGRHILGWIENGKIRIEEIHRFQNGLVGRNGHLCWDVDHLFHEVVEGLKRCRTLNRIPKSVGIDTWAVDFVLLDGAGQLLGDTVAYRDGRTQGMDALVYRTISEQALYARNGIQKQIFNSIYQLMAIRQESPEILSAAKHFLMIPDYLNYLLTGVMKNEYTNATTTQLVSAETQDWDYELMDMLGIPKEMFGAIAMPKTPVGALTEKIAAEVGFQTEVVLPATHDTGSAVMAVPSTSDDSIYLSSGTWSLMGIERLIPDCSEVSQRHNFTNEGGTAGVLRTDRAGGTRDGVRAALLRLQQSRPVLCRDGGGDRGGDGADVRPHSRGRRRLSGSVPQPPAAAADGQGGLRGSRGGDGDRQSDGADAEGQGL